MKGLKVRIPLTEQGKPQRRTKTDRTAKKTDKFVQEFALQQLASSFQDDSYYNKSQWDAIRDLQQDIKHYKSFDFPSKPKRLHKSKEISHSKISKQRLSELKAQVVRLESQNNRLSRQNQSLRNSIQQLSKKHKPIRDQFNSEIHQETLVYGNFIVSRLSQNPKLESLFHQRMGEPGSFLQDLQHPQLKPECLLLSLQLISDLIFEGPQEQISCRIPSIDMDEYNENSGDPLRDSSRNEDYSQMMDCSEQLLQTINDQSERIATLNRQISEAMISSKQLLTSPLSRNGRLK